jgi:predicted Zn-dependent protease
LTFTPRSLESLQAFNLKVFTMRKSVIRVTQLALAAALLMACGSKTVNPVTGREERSVMSESAELVEGKKGHEQILQEYKPLNNPRLQAYVNDIGQRLAKQSHRANIPWTFTVLDSPEINAFALPGGYVYVTRGIMAYMESEADLAGVVGHEIGHVTARHGAQRATRAQNAGLGVFAASVLGAVLESRGVQGAGQVASDVSQTAAAGYVARYGREQELQADGLGAEYLARVSYDPRNMIDVINVLKNQERFAADLARAEGREAPEPNSWLASHPSNDQRLETITRLSAQYKTNVAYQDEGRARYLQMMEGVSFGESPEQGLTRGRNFYHSGLGIAVTAGQGWRIQNEADKVTFINPQRDAGLVMQLVPPSAGRNHEEIIRNALKPDSGQVRRLTLNGLPATHFAGTQVVQNQRRGVEITLVSGPSNQTYALQYAAKDAATMQRARPGLQEVESSFRAMSAADTAAARPWAIKSVPYPRGGFAELARSSPLSNPEQQLRLINGVYGGGPEPKQGTLVKVVQ